jgi:TolB protein
VGFDRVYAKVRAGPVDVDLEAWMDSLKNGRTFATNGPLINFTLDGETVGDELRLDSPQPAVPFTARLNSIVPVDHFEVVCNGKVVQKLELDAARKAADVQGAIPVKESGWCVLRAWSEKPEYPVMDNYVYATTSPIYLTLDGKKPYSPEDVKYFAAWIARTIEITAAYPDWNSPQEKEQVLRRLSEAKQIYEKME